MRILKQAFLSLAILALALMVVRLARAPAQAGPQLVLRNGDVDCDGQINITDPLVLLNWLFGEGPEPCAIAQTDACGAELREEVATLRAALEKLSARIPGPKDILVLNGQIQLPRQGGEGVAYKVPEDKWLVLKFARFGAAKPELIQVLNGTREQIQVPNEQSQAWSAGFPIPPGTELIVSYPRPYCAEPCPFTVEFYLHGYLAAE